MQKKDTKSFHFRGGYNKEREYQVIRGPGGVGGGGGSGSNIIPVELSDSLPSHPDFRRNVGSFRVRILISFLVIIFFTIPFYNRFLSNLPFCRVRDKLAWAVYSWTFCLLPRFLFWWKLRTARPVLADAGRNWASARRTTIYSTL